MEVGVEVGLVAVAVVVVVVVIMHNSKASSASAAPREEPAHDIKNVVVIMVPFGIIEYMFPVHFGGKGKDNGRNVPAATIRCQQKPYFVSLEVPPPPTLQHPA